jgi:hypothetical protein
MNILKSAYDYLNPAQKKKREEERIEIIRETGYTVTGIRKKIDGYSREISLLDDQYKQLYDEHTIRKEKYKSYPADAVLEHLKNSKEHIQQANYVLSSIKKDFNIVEERLELMNYDHDNIDDDYIESLKQDAEFIKSWSEEVAIKFRETEDLLNSAEQLVKKAKELSVTPEEKAEQAESLRLQAEVRRKEEEEQAESLRLQAEVRRKEEEEKIAADPLYIKGKEANDLITKLYGDSNQFMKRIDEGWLKLHKLDSPFRVPQISLSFDTNDGSVFDMIYKKHRELKILLDEIFNGYIKAKTHIGYLGKTIDVSTIKQRENHLGQLMSLYNSLKLSHDKFIKWTPFLIESYDTFYRMSTRYADIKANVKDTEQALEYVFTTLLLRKDFNGWAILPAEFEKKGLTPPLRIARIELPKRMKAFDDKLKKSEKLTLDSFIKEFDEESKIVAEENDRVKKLAIDFVTMYSERVDEKLQRDKDSHLRSIQRSKINDIRQRVASAVSLARELIVHSNSGEYTIETDIKNLAKDIEMKAAAVDADISIMKAADMQDDKKLQENIEIAKRNAKEAENLIYNLLDAIKERAIEKTNGARQRVASAVSQAVALALSGAFRDPAEIEANIKTLAEQVNDASEKVENWYSYKKNKDVNDSIFHYISFATLTPKKKYEEIKDKFLEKIEYLQIAINKAEQAEKIIEYEIRDKAEQIARAARIRDLDLAWDARREEERVRLAQEAERAAERARQEERERQKERERQADPEIVFLEKLAELERHDPERARKIKAERDALKQTIFEYEQKERQAQEAERERQRQAPALDSQEAVLAWRQAQEAEREQKAERFRQLAERERQKEREVLDELERQRQVPPFDIPSRQAQEAERVRQRQAPALDSQEAVRKRKVELAELDELELREERKRQEEERKTLDRIAEREQREERERQRQEAERERQLGLGGGMQGYLQNILIQAETEKANDIMSARGTGPTPGPPFDSDGSSGCDHNDVLPNELDNFLQNAKIKVLTNNSISCITLLGTYEGSTLRNTRYPYAPIKKLLYKFFLVKDEEGVIYHNPAIRKTHIEVQPITTYRAEIYRQVDLYNKMYYLAHDPNVPNIIMGLSKIPLEHKGQIFNAYSRNLSAGDRALLYDFFDNQYKISICIMEYMDGYMTLWDYFSSGPSREDVTLVRTYVQFELLLLICCGFKHIDAHDGNVMINTNMPNYYGPGINFKIIIIDFGRGRDKFDVGVDQVIPVDFGELITNPELHLERAKEKANDSSIIIEEMVLILKTFIGALKGRGQLFQGVDVNKITYKRLKPYLDILGSKKSRKRGSKFQSKTFNTKRSSKAKTFGVKRSSKAKTFGVKRSSKAKTFGVKRSSKAKTFGVKRSSKAKKFPLKRSHI